MKKIIFLIIPLIIIAIIGIRFLKNEKVIYECEAGYTATKNENENIDKEEADFH